MLSKFTIKKCQFEPEVVFTKLYFYGLIRTVVVGGNEVKQHSLFLHTELYSWPEVPKVHNSYLETEFFL